MMRTLIRSLTAIALIAALPAVAAQAQPAVAATTLPADIRAGACSIIVTLADVGADTRVQLELNKKALTSTKANGQKQVTVRLNGPLDAGDVVRARKVDGTKAAEWGEAREVQEGSAAPECQAEPTATSDGREPFEVSAYFGRQVDNFAPAVAAGYANPEAGGQQWSYDGGFDFEFRAAGGPTSGRQLWLFGETVHGVRSADVDCSAGNTDKPPVCGKLSQVDQAQALRFVLDKATSIEAFAGARFEFLTLQRETSTPAKLYLVARLGVMMLDGQTTLNLKTLDLKTDPGGRATFDLQVNRAYPAYHFGAGLLMPKGEFRGSYVEVGFGRTDLFTSNGLNPWRRLKIDGLLSIPFKRGLSDRWPRAYAQLYSDFDPTHQTADSIQTYYGVQFDVVGLFSK